MRKLSLRSALGLLVPFLILAVEACSGHKALEDMTAEEKMQTGDAYYAEEDWTNAIEYYQEVVFERNAAFTAEAQMKLGNCYFFDGQYADAIIEYEELIRLFPDYRDIEPAYFNIAVSWWEESLPAQYDQEETNRAIDAFQIFLEKFPNSERKSEARDYLDKCARKLREKAFHSGYIYYMTWDYPAALMYFDEIISYGAGDEFERKSLFYSAKIHLERDEIEKARFFIELLVDDFPGSDEADDLQGYLETGD